jgi:hypothetical protein
VSKREREKVLWIQGPKKKIVIVGKVLEIAKKVYISLSNGWCIRPHMNTPGESYGMKEAWGG